MSVKVGDEFMCIENYSKVFEYTPGQIYTVTEVDHDNVPEEPYDLSSDLDHGYIFSMCELYGDPRDETLPLFKPLTEYSDRELFTYKMTGRLPINDK